MNIFNKIKNSIYNPAYYQEVMAKPFSYSFKYLLVFGLLFALVFTIVVTIKFIPIVNMLSEKAPQLATYFPQDLKITIKDGKVSTNVQEPYFVKMPQELKNNASLNSANIKVNGSAIQTDTKNMDNLVVIDTKDKFDIDTYNSYKTFMLVTADSVIYVNKDNQTTITSLSGVKDLTLTRSTVLDFINVLTPFLVILYPVVFVGAYVLGFMSVILKMFYLLFGALLVWAVAGIKGMKIGYKKAYIIGMPLMTSAIIIVAILNAFPTKMTFAFLFSILLIISAVINLKKPVEQPVATTPVA